MSDNLFDVVFFGILQTGKSKEVVMQNMAALFKTDTSRLAPYFSGGRKVIKGKLNAAAAEKYKTALENIGLIIKIEPCLASAENSQAAAKPETEPAIDTSGITLAPLGTDVIETPVQVTPQKIDDISDITMAEAGANVIENPVKVTPQEIGDISDLTMAKAGANVLDHPVKVAPQEIGDISDLTMAEAGVSVLDHPPEVIAQKIADISDMSLAEPGADLIANPKPVEKAKVPDISKLSLDDDKK